jgi:hypothetical protein
MANPLRFLSPLLQRREQAELAGQAALAKLKAEAARARNSEFRTAEARRTAEDTAVESSYITDTRAQITAARAAVVFDTTEDHEAIRALVKALSTLPARWQTASDEVLRHDEELTALRLHANPLMMNPSPIRTSRARWVEAMGRLCTTFLAAVKENKAGGIALYLEHLSRARPPRAAFGVPPEHRDS